VVVLLYALPIAAGQKEDASAAREHARRAAAAYNLGQYTEASHEFEAAYKLVQDPALLFNVGQSYRLGGEREKALTAYKSYLRTAPANAIDRQQAERWKAELEAAPAAATTTGNEASPAPERAPRPADVTDSAAPVATIAPPPTAPLETPPAAVVNLSPPPPPPEGSTPSETDSPFYKRWWFWTLLGAAAAGTITALILTRDRSNPDCLGVSPCGSIP
jgi:tetratricopeptide (TPR) repeat protein